MISFKVDTNGLGVRIPQVGIYVADRVAASVVHHGQLLRTRVMAKASGRPGPNAPTGDYRRSITLEIVRGTFSISAVVGTNKPQGRRLEYGFVGVDSAGRHYDQPPYPHFLPAQDEIGRLMVQDIDRIVKGATQ